MAQEHKTRNPPFEFELPNEGLYGFTIVVRSGAGLGDQPPGPGDPPQKWVEVDTTPPLVRVLNVEVPRGPDLGKVFITWQATDKNLSPQPITLSYATAREGPWNVFASKEENTGRYTWSVPADAPAKLFIRVQATDKAGNEGSDVFAKEIVVDVSMPRGRIIGFGSANKAGP